MSPDYNIDFDDEKEDKVQSKESYSLNITDRENRDAEPSSKAIHKGMLIAEIMEEHPDVVPMIMDYGIHCVGCGGAAFETLEEGFMGHGIPDDEIDRIINDLNDFIKSSAKYK